MIVNMKHPQFHGFFCSHHSGQSIHCCRYQLLLPVLLILIWGNSSTDLALQQEAELSESPCKISFDEVSRLYLYNDRVIKIDVRPPSLYASLRINNSLNIPAYNIKRKSYLREKHIILMDQGHNQLSTKRPVRT